MFGFNEAMLGLTQNMYLEVLENTSIVYPVFRRTGNKSDGNFNPASNITLTKTVYQWDEVNIPVGVTVNTMSPGALILCRKITVSGLLTASGKGANGGAGGVGAERPGGAGASGGGYIGAGGGSGSGSSDMFAPGGAGGNGRTLGGAKANNTGNNGINDVNAFFDFWKALSSLVGAGGGGGGGGAYYGAHTGGAGGNGGGYIYICANEIAISSGGAIRAEGLNGGNGSDYVGAGGGGGGGALIIDALKLINNGAISVAGGMGGSAPYSGGKGGTGFLCIIERGLR